MRKIDFIKTKLETAVSNLKEAELIECSVHDKILVDEALKLCEEALEQITFLKIKIPEQNIEQVVHESDDDQKDDTTLFSKDRKFKVFIVDDDSVTQSILSVALKKRGLQITSYLDPLKALRDLKVLRPDLIVLDIMMPQLNGFDFLIQLKKMFPDNPPKVLVGSARQYTADRLKCLKLGADDFMDKPYDLRILTERLQGLLK